jgi:hypothetical protein
MPSTNLLSKMVIKGNKSMFIKRGGDTDGKITAVIDPDELTETQKKAAKELADTKPAKTEILPGKKSGS